MMNILTERLPTSVEIDGVEYELNTDFRVCIKIMLAFEDPELTNAEKQAVMLNLLYKEIPPDILKASKMAVKFLNCGEDDNSGSSSSERYYSFQKDAKYIYTAIRQSHDIDLETIDYLHWWKFCYLFMDIKPDCFFSQILDLRIRKSRGKLTKEEREYCARIKDIIELPRVLSPEESAAHDKFLKLLGGE
ncbi:MAG TPA: hypothetical protein GXX54_08925 [Clostridiales bacterium]|nr:hypothetical protein [Clostridiales bacterium]